MSSTTTVRFIGDVHGKWARYRKLIKGCPVSLQVGDFGVGFCNSRTGKVSSPPFKDMAGGQHRFIRGNHDNPAACREHPSWVEDGQSFFSVFCVGGAGSIDQAVRTHGVDWWPEEELSYRQLCEVLDRYAAQRPSVVVTHDAPECLTDRLCSMVGSHKNPIGQGTRQAFDSMLSIHRPDLWIHGHWHVDHHTILDGVEFIGLNELSFVDIPVPS